MTSQKRNVIVGVMGGGEVPRATVETAFRLGELIAEHGWVLLTGGRNSGVMEASARGARKRGGLTIGILPDADRSRASEYIDIPIVTGMGNARNSINVLSSDVVVACQGGAGTLSEIALALKVGKPVILIDYPEDPLLASYMQAGRLHHADSPETAVRFISSLI